MTHKEFSWATDYEKISGFYDEITTVLNTTHLEGKDPVNDSITQLLLKPGIHPISMPPIMDGELKLVWNKYDVPVYWTEGDVNNDQQYIANSNGYYENDVRSSIEKLSGRIGTYGVSGLYKYPRDSLKDNPLTQKYLFSGSVEDD
jgi:hypothetical protein